MMSVTELRANEAQIKQLLPSLSIVIIGRNEGERLVRCILSAKVIDGWRPAEMIYVDSGSTDESLQVAARLGAKVLPLPPGAFTAARARNLGWRNSLGEYVLFLDGDTILNAAFPLLALEEILKDAQTAAVWGHRREILPAQSVYVRVLDLDWYYLPGESLFFGGDVLVRRRALEAVNGFDETLIAGEEPEMCRRMRNLGLHIQHIDVPMTLHDLAITRFSQYWKRSQRAGYAFAAVSERFRYTSDPFWTEDLRRNRVRGVFWLVSPLLACAASLMLRSGWPLLLWVALVAVSCLRSAWLYRWKPGRWTTILLYGVHSHLQQIPVFLGQLEFQRNRHKSLIEYKDLPPGTKAAASRHG